MGKTTFVNVNDGLTLFLETLNLFAKGMPSAFVRLWVREGFFSLGAFVLIRIREITHILCKHLKVNLEPAPALVFFRLKLCTPTHKTGDTNGKPLCGL